MAFIQYSMIFLLSLNRLSMMIFVNSYEKCWRRIFPWILIAIVVFPITQTWSIATSNSYYLYVEKLDGYLAKTVADVTGILDVLLTFMGVITILTMSTNILAIIRLYFLADRITEVEKNLFFVSFVAFVIQCIAAGDTVS
uniref:Serpentine receptor class gamma n=3 Tax=Caenorhabditis japonica TaxID=281687 RepID=A0A8R1IDZ0_CAEJA